jgi:ribonucleotide monophosphatase NagD (HAD superfamily)
MGKVAEMALEGCEPRDAGITGVPVRTGKYRPDALAQASDVPDNVIDSLAHLHMLLQVD